MAHIVIALAAVGASVFGLVPSASAQDAARPDPDSPAGVEYQLPLDRAREEATGSQERSSGRTPLFGVGIARNAGEGGNTGGGSSGDGASSGGSGSGAGTDGNSAGAAARGNGEGSTDVRRASLSAPSGSGGDSGGLGATWLVLAVLAAGAALGFVLRRGLRDPSG